ncbi:MAG: nucleoside triphosphate pyrophosphohydrolase family protein [Planctomycetota bacterium]|nr:nucleoside triphosphate pyrophosphohydrolase family protein [Planctomycetota bacterium]
MTKATREFRTVYGLTNSLSSRETQLNLIAEEYKEFVEAHNHEDRAECLKELCDLIYVCWQYGANMGWDLDEALRRVHMSNMSKLGEDGKPIYRVDGKVLKGPRFKPPQLGDLV